MFRKKYKRSTAPPRGDRFKADQTHLWLLVLVLALLIGPVILCYVVYTFFKIQDMSRSN